jgi:predicted CopG family antitoxin
MGSRTISLKDEAYTRLKALKGKDKSFSDVILELTSERGDKFENVAGEGIDTSFKELKEERKRSEEDDGREALLR